MAAATVYAAICFDSSRRLELGRLENTLQREVARKRQEEASRRAPTMDAKLYRAKILDLAKALKKERQVFRRYQAEVTTGHCTQVVKRVVAGQEPDGSEKVHETCRDVDLWVCAIRWPDRSYERVWVKKLDITFADGQYCLLKPTLAHASGSDREHKGSGSTDRDNEERESRDIQLTPIGDDLGAVQESIAKEFAGTNADYLYSFSRLTIEKPETTISQGFFKRRWDL